jgi:hypothetical protein
MLDDWRPYVYRTRDYGRSWTRLTTGDNGIPGDYPVRVVREDPVRPGLLYAGAEFGVYVSFDDGARWQPLQLDLPVRAGHRHGVPGRRPGDLHHGAGLPRAPGPHAAPAATTRRWPGPAPPPSAGHRRSLTWGGGGVGVGPRRRPNTAQPGAVVDWVLAEEPAALVTVELLDADGVVLNGWTSEDGLRCRRRRWRGLGMPGQERCGCGGPRVPSAAGHSRFVVPLRHAGPVAPAGRQRARVPLAPWARSSRPGSYRSGSPWGSGAESAADGGPGPAGAGAGHDAGAPGGAGGAGAWRCATC